MEAFPEDFYASVLPRPLPLQMKIERMLPGVRKRVYDALQLEGAPYVVYYNDDVARGALEMVAVELRKIGFKAEFFPPGSPLHTAKQPGLEIVRGDMKLKREIAVAQATAQAVARKVCDECLKLPYHRAIECAHVPVLRPEELNALKEQLARYRYENPDIEK